MSNNIDCSCKDLRTLIEGDGVYIAREVFCSLHGYRTNCFICTNLHIAPVLETCRKHSSSKMLFSHNLKQWEEEGYYKRTRDKK